MTIPTNPTLGSSKDRRRARRTEWLGRVACKTAAAYVMGQCQDISELGMLVKAPGTFDVSQTVSLRFVLPALPTPGLLVQTKGRVVRTLQAKYMALEFVDLKPLYRNAVAKLVSEAANETTNSR
jgi:hypothetical protein